MKLLKFNNFNSFNNLTFINKIIKMGNRQNTYRYSEDGKTYLYDKKFDISQYHPNFKLYYHDKTIFYEG